MCTINHTSTFCTFNNNVTPHSTCTCMYMYMYMLTNMYTHKQSQTDRHWLYRPTSMPQQTLSLPPISLSSQLLSVHKATLSDHGIEKKVHGRLLVASLYGIAGKLTNIGDFPQTRQFAKLKTSPRYTVYRY